MDQKFLQVRLAVLTLHRSLLNAERLILESERGFGVAPAEFLQLLINDERFSWVKPLSEMIVQMDEALDAPRRGKEEPNGDMILAELRALLEGEEQDSLFTRRYLELAQDPAVLLAHQALFNVLEG